MKVHPTQKKRNLITSNHNGVVSSTATANPNPKKLKRLPHVFAKVLELPFTSDADVSVQETRDSFRFVANSTGSVDDDGDINTAHDFRAQVIKILPGVTKIAVLRVLHGGRDDSSMEELDIDVWRFRLPSITCPEMTSATCVEGQLVVTVPKAVNVEDMVRDNYIGDEEDGEDEISWIEDKAIESLLIPC